MDNRLDEIRARCEAATPMDDDFADIGQVTMDYLRDVGWLLAEVERLTREAVATNEGYETQCGYLKSAAEKLLQEAVKFKSEGDALKTRLAAVERERDATIDGLLIDFDAWWEQEMCDKPKLHDSQRLALNAYAMWLQDRIHGWGGRGPEVDT